MRFELECLIQSKNQKKYLPDGELNPGLPRDRRGYLPLYYRGLDNDTETELSHVKMEKTSYTIFIFIVYKVYIMLYLS